MFFIKIKGEFLGGKKMKKYLPKLLSALFGVIVVTLTKDPFISILIAVPSVLLAEHIYSLVSK